MSDLGLPTYPALIYGLALPEGWRWANPIGRSATLEWPRLNLAAVISDPNILRRDTLSGRFQLFEMDETGDWIGSIYNGEDYTAFLSAFDRARASR